MDHSTDTDCTLDDHDTCIDCGVYHGDYCPDCGGRGYHAHECSYQCDDCFEKMEAKIEADIAKAIEASEAEDEARESASMVSA